MDAELLRWEADDKEIMEKRHREKVQKRSTRKRRRVATYSEEREKNLERAHRAKAAMEENPDAQKKGKWPRCTQ